jgi:predicted DNA-binding transcriptional regulator YafY
LDQKVVLTEIVSDTAFAADGVRGRRLHSSQELTELAKGALRVRLRLNSLEEIQRWVLSMGEHATVVRPHALVERVAAVGRELVGRHGT